VAAPVLVASAAVAVPLVANAAVSLPNKTPEQILALVANEKVSALSGTLQQTSDLGLPQLPDTGSGADATASSMLQLVSGSHTSRVYVDGATKLRVQILDKLAERDLIRSGSELWLYDSSDKKVSHSVLPSDTAGTDPAAPGGSVTPAQLAKELIASLDPTTKLTVDPNLRVAGRTAYDLVLTPKSTDTLLGAASIAVDSETGLPLRVSLAARGQQASAASIGFTSISLAKPDASLFSFSPPAGSTVTQHTIPAKSKSSATAPGDTSPRPTVIGDGWSAVIAVPADPTVSKLLSSPLYSRLTSAVAGGRLLHTSLVNVLVTSDGRIFAGSVSAARLQSAASAQK
jgi:outer membrane lipoprotein-sorting protein